MVDGIPLKQVLEPGRYRVEWAVPVVDGDPKQITGDIELKADGSPTGWIYGGIPLRREYEDLKEPFGVLGRPIATLPQRHEHALLSGEIVDGKHVVLVDAVVVILGPRDASIRAKAALVGKLRFTESELRIYQVEVQFEGLDAILGEAPLRAASSPNLSGGPLEEWTYGAIGNPESTIRWSDDGVELELRFDHSVTKPEEAYFYQVTFSPVLLLRFQEPVGFDAVFSDWIEPLRRIVSLSTGRRERITHVAVGAYSNDPSTNNAGIRGFNFQVYGSDLHQEPFASRGNDVREIKCAFRVSADDLSLLSLLRQWQVLAAAHHPLLETYGAMMFARDQHPRSRFLLLIQAIEGLHGNETRDEYEKKKGTHKSLRESVLEEASETLSPKSFKFLEKYLMKEPISGLDQRIRDVLAGAPVDVGTELEATPLVRKVKLNDLQKKNPTRPDLAGALRIIRNDLAHGNRGYDARELDEVVELLDGVVRAHLLRILCCPEEAQKLAQEQRR